jgi:hypothetical protein
VVAQWSDGFGEGGIVLSTKEGDLLVVPSDDEDDLSIEESSDGREVPLPSQVAIEARRGHVDALAAALDSGADVNAELGGYNALHLAILEGHVDVVTTLLERGADVERVDRMGSSPLALVALSNVLDDAASVQIARALMAKGARVGADGQDPVDLALSRDKNELAKVLSDADRS